MLTGALMAGTALPGLAASNFANATQSGIGNDGKVIQGPGDNNALGTAALAATQDGDANALEIEQSGDDNEIGTEGGGFLQTSNRNTAIITQSSSENSVRQVTQTGIDATAGGETLRRNTLRITQETGDGNIISGVAQTRSVEANTAAGNSAVLTQTGQANIIGSATGASNAFVQNGYAQSAVLTQTGTGNIVDSVAQTGPDNTLTVAFTGTGNGTADFTVPTAITGAWNGLTQGAIVQNSSFAGAGIGDGNRLNFTATADDTRFGFSQTGNRNIILGSISGGGSQANETGVVQLGDDNDAGFTVFGSTNQLYIQQGVVVASPSNVASATLTGDRNGVGIRQDGAANEATVALTGSDNSVNVMQQSALTGNSAVVTISGDFNDITLDQGGDSTAGIDIHGDTNLLNVAQLNGANTLTLDIWGDGNNAATAGAFTGAALTAAQVVAPNLTPGTIIQNGAGNTITYSVGASGSLSNQNLFAFSQTGQGNLIEGTTTGSFNQVVIVQSGSANQTHFTQIGNNNVIGVTQG